MKALLLAGGTGTRLWPISKKTTPKQSISPFQKDKNLLEMTIERTIELGFNPKDISLITTEEQSQLFIENCNNYHLAPTITEPFARNTAPAILLGAKKLLSEGLDKGEAIYVFPSDQYIEDFQPNLNIALDDMILCFRIVPSRVETGYGYIQPYTGGIIRKVRLFTEKPNIDIAKEWYQSWIDNPEGPQEEKYFWNSGIYAFTLNSLTECLRRLDSEFCEMWLNSSYDDFVQNYEQLPKESFDVFIAEKAYNLHSAPLNAKSWRDVGTWQSVYEALAYNNLEQNIHIGQGQIITADTTSCLIKSDKQINIACAGIENLAIIIDEDKILIADKSNPNAMQELISKLQNNYPDLI